MTYYGPLWHTLSAEKQSLQSKILDRQHYSSERWLESKAYKPEISAEDICEHVLDLEAEFSGGSYNDGKRAIPSTETRLLCL